ncbi:MAG: protease inhibitor I42 family protein [Bacteroidota bacterium]
MKPLFYLSLLSFLFISCNYQTADKSAPLINSFSEDENFRIRLPENHTNGYMWQINTRFDKNLLDYYGSVFRGNEAGVDFNFTTLKTGKDTLNFALIRYTDTLELKQFIIEVK